MTRGRPFVLPLALTCLLAGACAGPKPPARQHPSPSLSSPGPQILLSVLAGSVSLVDPSTGRMTTLASNLSDYQAGFASWEPDHRRLAYGDGGIVIVDLATGRRTTVARGPAVSMPSWSPDGAFLAYGNGVALWLASAEGSNAAPVRLVATLAPLGMAWGPTGMIALEGLERDCSRSFACTSTDRSEIWTVTPDSANLHQVTHVGHAASPKWSPDGSRLLYIERSAGTDRGSLWSIGADGSGASRMTSANDVVAADWSPDGHQLAVVRPGTSPQTLQLWVGDSNGSALQAVGSPVAGSEASVDW